MKEEVEKNEEEEEPDSDDDGYEVKNYVPQRVYSCLNMTT